MTYTNRIILAVSVISNPSTQHSSSLQCLFLNLGISADDVTYFQILYWLSLPFVKIFLMIFILTILYLMKKIKQLKNYVIIAIIFILMNEQSGILLNLGKYSSCFLGNETRSAGYVQVDPNINCSDLDI